MNSNFPMASAALKGIIILGALSYVIYTQEITFTGEQFAWINLKSIASSARRNFLYLRFRTVHENGMLVYSDINNNGCYYRLELIKGSLSFSSRLGGNHVTNISLGSDLADGKWHSVRVKPTRRQTQITLDSYPKTELAGEGYNRHSLDGTLYLASAGKHQTRNRFRGCLADFNFDGRKVLVEALRGRFPRASSGNLRNGCVYDDYSYSLVSFLSPTFYMKIKKVPKPSIGNTNIFSTSFKFRTYLKEGVFISRTTSKLKLLLRLQSGALLFEVALPNGYKFVLKVGRRLSDGEWHTVRAGIYSTNMTVLVDQQSRTKVINYKQMNKREFFYKLSYHVLAGKDLQTNHPSFVGCLMSLTLNNHSVSERDYDIAQRDGGLSKGVCSLKNRCYPNLCKNSGICEQKYNSYNCNCSGTDFQGKTCEDTIYRQTCAEYRQFGLQKDSHCKLKGKNSRKLYTALCNATEVGNIYTIIRHMKMGNRSVAEDVVNDFGYLVHEIEYPLGLDQIKALVQSSEHCRQFIRYDCIRSALFDSPRGPPRAMWLSRDGRTHTYWGGADRDSNMHCACGKNSNCVNTRKYCNCDVKDAVWRFDEGYFTEKDLLPVTELKFSTEGGNLGKSYFTLGPLECWGSVRKVISTSERNILTRACNPVPLPTALPTTKRPSTTDGVTTAAHCDHDHCSTNKKFKPSTSTQTTQRLISRSSVARTIPLLGNKVANAYKNKKNGTPPSLEEFKLSITAIVLISCVLVVVLLLVIRCELPKIVVCVRGLSRRGEANFTTAPPRNRIPVTAL